MPSSPWEEGNPNADVLIVSTAPAGSEMRLRRPQANLMGSGGVYNSCLSEGFGWRKGQVPERRQEDLYYLNLWQEPVTKDKAQPPNLYLNGSCVCKGSKIITEAGWEAAAPALAKLAAWKGKVLVPMGGPALNAITDRIGIGKWRGSPLEGKLYLGTDLFDRTGAPENLEWIIPTYDPANALDREGGQYLSRYHIERDLAKVARYVAGHQPEGAAAAQLHIAPTFREAMAFSKHCASKRLVNVDVEVSVTRRHMTCYSLAVDTNEAMCIPLLDEHLNHYWSESEEYALIEVLAQSIEDPQTTICNQNLLFDLWILFMEWGIVPRGPVADTMCGYGIVNLGLDKDLGTICADLTDVKFYKDDAKAWIEKKLFEDVGSFWRYSARDSVAPLEAWLGNSWQPGLAAQLRDEGFQRTYDMTVRPFPVLFDMMSRGMSIDRDQLDVVATAYQAHLREKQRELDKHVGRPLNPNSAPQCMKYFYEELGIDPYKNDKGKPAVDKKALLRLSRRPESATAAQLIMQLRKERKLGSTYFDVDLDPDGRMRCSWNPRGTGFGRLSSSSTIYGTGMNVQNLPVAFRSFLVAG